MSNTPKTHNNFEVQEFLDGFLTAFELCREYPAMDDILSGVLALKTTGNTSTRSLSRRILFTILQQCPTIDTASVDLATGGRYAYATLASYAASARVASKATHHLIGGGALETEGSLAEARRRLDDPFDAQLRAQIQISNLKEGCPERAELLIL